jgi:hypothetical protein
MLQRKRILAPAQLRQRIGQKLGPFVVGARQRAQIEANLRLLL